MRILVTGSRDWDDPWIIEQMLRRAAYGHREVTLVSGHCPNGVDAYAEEIAYELDWHVEIHPAEWLAWGKRAGFIRNQQMVDLGADICLAFRRNNSKGTTHCGQAAEAAGIPTVWIEYEALDS
jgi:YspA, cpYpsA-related SLOG family